MRTAAINTIEAMFLDEDGSLLGSEQDALDVVGATYGTDVTAIVIPAGRFDPDFFDLGSKKAGHFIQKLQNYGLRLVIVGDLSAQTARSKALADFIGETNRIGHHFFAADRAMLDANFGKAG